MMEEKFYDLALKKLSGRASEEELSELEELLSQDSSLQEKYDQLAKETSAVKELIPLIKQPVQKDDELPEYEKNLLLDEVRETFEAKDSTAETTLETDNQGRTESLGFWGWALGLGVTAALIIFLISPQSDPVGTDKKPEKMAKVQTVEIEFAMLVPGEVRGSEEDPSKKVKQLWKESSVETFEEPEDLDNWEKDWPKTEADLQVKVLQFAETLIIKGRNNQIDSGVSYNFNEETGKINITLPKEETLEFDGKSIIFSKKIEATLKGGVLSEVKGIKAKEGLTARVREIKLENGEIVIVTFWKTKRFKLKEFERIIAGVKDGNLESKLQETRETIEQLKEKR
tara:strand:- start:77 stop:1102 length:1026 start_codon:yes stop_codon:yes gene_type:complete